MKFFPILGTQHRRDLIAILEKDFYFLEKWGLNSQLLAENAQTLDKLLSHPRRMWMFLGDSEDLFSGISVFSFQGIPHSFAQLDLVLQPANMNQFRLSIETLTQFGFQEMALQSLQMTLLEGEDERKNALLDLGWSLDVVLQKERLWKGRWVDEYRLGKLRPS